MPAVSVIMPAYNIAPYIGAAIASVCAQTRGDLELLVIDDGSRDSTAAIAADCAARDGRIRLLRKSNGGISSARNLGLREATAPFIAILDGDDLWSPQFLGAQLGLLEGRDDVDIVTGNGWFLGGRRNGQLARPYPDPRPAPDLGRILADETSVFIMSVFKRRVCERIAAFDETLRTNEDYDFWIRAAAAGFRFVRNDVPLGWYRRREDSLSAGEIRMLSGILHVYHKNRPLVAHDPSALAILDRQIARFEAELLAAETRHALDEGNYPAAADALAALYQRRGGAALGVARFAARWAPGLFTKAYHFRRARMARAAR